MIIMLSGVEDHVQEGGHAGRIALHLLSLRNRKL
jgi:hypothetical protein